MKTPLMNLAKLEGIELYMESMLLRVRQSFNADGGLSGGACAIIFATRDMNGTDAASGPVPVPFPATLVPTTSFIPMVREIATQCLAVGVLLVSESCMCERHFASHPVVWATLEHRALAERRTWAAPIATGDDGRRTVGAFALLDPPSVAALAEREGGGFPSLFPRQIFH